MYNVVTLKRNSFPSHLIEKKKRIRFKTNLRQKSSRRQLSKVTKLSKFTKGTSYYQLPFIGDFSKITK